MNSIVSAAYWEVGRRIVEFEQAGRTRADYGERIIEQLSIDLSKRYGRGFGRSNLFQIRAFHLAYRQKVQTVFGQLSPDYFDVLRKALPLPWSQYSRLLSIESPAAREFYETEALRGGWSARQLDRQIATRFFERTALSRNKAAMLHRGTKKQVLDMITPEEAIKDPYILEFLGLKDEYSESNLEEGLIRRLEDFLMELGGDFAFIGRQKRLRIGNEWFRIDLLFFHRRLRCLVVIDLLCGRSHNKPSVVNFIMWPCPSKSREFGETSVWGRHISGDYSLRRNSIKSLSSRHFTREVVRLTSQRANALAFISKSTSA